MSFDAKPVEGARCIMVDREYVRYQQVACD